MFAALRSPTSWFVKASHSLTQGGNIESKRRERLQACLVYPTSSEKIAIQTKLIQGIVFQTVVIMLSSIKLQVKSSTDVGAGMRSPAFTLLWPSKKRNFLYDNKNRLRIIGLSTAEVSTYSFLSIAVLTPYTISLQRPWSCRRTNLTKSLNTFELELLCGDTSTSQVLTFLSPNST